MKSGRLVLGAIFIALSGAAAWLVMDGGVSEERGRGGWAVSVVSEKAAMRTFTDIVEALGTAKARESVTLNARVSDTVRKVHFRDGQLVKAGDVLVELEDSEEQAQLAEAEANLREAERSFKRIQNLVEQGNASPAALDTEQRKLDEARFRVDASAARLADQKIVAPFDGLLGLRQVSEGSLISPNTPITTIDAIDRINLDFSVPERFIATLKPGQNVEAKVSAYPGRLFKGQVTTINSRIDPVTRSVIVRAEIVNDDKALKPGLLMTVEVINRSWQGIGVAEEAVVPTGGKTYVFVVKGDAAERREVTLGLRRPGYVEVTGGLEEGERVVTEGTMRLGRRGMKVIDMAKDVVKAGGAS